MWPEITIWVYPPGQSYWSQQGLLAKYLIPECIGRAVKLGSERSSSNQLRLENWKSEQTQTAKMEIQHAQHVYRVLISSTINSNSLGPFCV